MADAIRRVIVTKYDGQCRRCGVHLPRGSRVAWFGGGQVECLSCPRTDQAGRGGGPRRGERRLQGASGSSPSEPKSRGPDSEVLTRWHGLVSYHAAAVRMESMLTAPDVRESGRWSVVQGGQETLITGTAVTLNLDEAASMLFDRLDVGDAVFYGWPTVVFEVNGHVKIAPLLVVPLERVNPADRHAQLSEEVPFVNPGILHPDAFDPEAVSRVEAMAISAPPRGDRSAVVQFVHGICGILGLDSSDVDPERLRQMSGLVGVQNVPMLFHGRAGDFTASLLEDLSELRSRRDFQRTAARWLLETPVEAKASVARASKRSRNQPRVLGIEGLDLNDSQESAVSAALAQEFSVITGPPGTGKSQVVASVVASQVAAGYTVLVASTNNMAVEVASDRCARVDPLLLVRTGSRVVRGTVAAQLRASRKNTGPVPSPELDMAARHLRAAESERAKAQKQLDARASAEKSLAEGALAVDGLRTLLWPDGVPQEVLSRKGRLVRLARRARGSRWEWLKGLRTRRLIRAAAPSRSGVSESDVLDWASAEEAFDFAHVALSGLGAGDADTDLDALAEAKSRWLASGSALLQLVITESVFRGHRHIRDVIDVHMDDTTSARRRKEANRAVLPYVRGWATTSQSVRPNFPLEPGLFDLLIIDEASQCSIATILPLLYRAKRVAVLGDPDQLQPIVTLTAPIVEQIAKNNGLHEVALERDRLSALSDSAFTAFASRAPEVLLLDEHYRCHPDIASIMSNEFYGGRLRTLTDVAALRGQVRGVRILDVPGTTRRDPSSRSSYNEAEAEAIDRWLSELRGFEGTVGVVTPFKAQSRLLERRLAAHVRELDLRIGTAHRFQGDERDLMLFSMVLADDVATGTAGWVESTRNLINVAISRARSGLVMVGDVASISTMETPTLQAVLRAAGRAGEESSRDVEPVRIAATQKLASSLRARGESVREGIEIEGYYLDLALEGGEGLLIQVDTPDGGAAHGRMRRQAAVERGIIRKLGREVYRVDGWRCLLEPEDVASRVLQHARRD